MYVGDPGSEAKDKPNQTVTREKTELEWCGWWPREHWQRDRAGDLYLCAEREASGLSTGTKYMGRTKNP